LQTAKCAYPAALGLEIGGRIWASTGIVVLLKVGLERRGLVTGVTLVSKSRACAESHIIIVFVHPRPTLPHAQENERNTAEQKSTTNTADDAADDILIGFAQTAAAIAASLCARRTGDKSSASSEEGFRGTSRSNCDILTIALGGKDAGEFLE